MARQWTRTPILNSGIRFPTRILNIGKIRMRILIVEIPQLRILRKEKQKLWNRRSIPSCSWLLKEKWIQRSLVPLNRTGGTWITWDLLKFPRDIVLLWAITATIPSIRVTSKRALLRRRILSEGF